MYSADGVRELTAEELAAVNRAMIKIIIRKAILRIIVTTSVITIVNILVNRKEN